MSRTGTGGRRAGKSASAVWILSVFVVVRFPLRDFEQVDGDYRCEPYEEKSQSSWYCLRDLSGFCPSVITLTANKRIVIQVSL